MSDLTVAEQANVRAALHFLKVQAGRWDLLEKALNVGKNGLPHVMRGEKPVSPALAFKTARLAQVGVDALLAGEFPPEGTCPHCGHRKRDAA